MMTLRDIKEAIPCSVVCPPKTEGQTKETYGKVKKMPPERGGKEDLSKKIV